MPKKWPVSFFVIFFLIYFPKICLAESSLILYKFSSDNGPDWVEIVNNSEDNIDTSSYHIKDESSEVASLSCNLKPGGHYLIDCGNRLNKAGDVIYLIRELEVASDCVAYGPGKSCVEGEPADLQQPVGGSYGIWSGTAWGITEDSSKADNTDCLSPTPTITLASVETPTITLTPTPVSTSTPTPTLIEANATYKINKPRDGDDNAIKSVKIYIDGVYIHHYDDEILTFCDDCFCDDLKEVACNFGEHEIKLEKSDYQNWTET